MIKNQRQYAATRKQIKLFEDALARWSPATMPEGVDPVIHRAQRDGFESELEILCSDLAEYEALQKGEIETISLCTLDELPLGLIKARIARGLTQKELADKIGVKAQQVQRWEHEDYEKVGFSSMVDIAHALDLNISEVIRLPSKPRPAFATLKELGIGKDFIKARLVPKSVRWRVGQLSDADLLAAAAGRLERVFGCHVEIDGTVANDDRFLLAAGEARFKLPVDAQSHRVKAYALYARYLAGVVAKGVAHLPQKAVPRDWKELRLGFFGEELPSLEGLLAGAWEFGVAILPLSDPIRFHGVCWRIDGRNVIVVKQRLNDESRWAFDILHEIYHAGEAPELQSMEYVDCDATEAERRESEEEKCANEFAGNVLLNGKANELYLEVIRLAKGDVSRFKKTVVAVALGAGVNQGYLANYVAHRLKTEQFIDWWGAASNLQLNEIEPFGVAKKLLFSHLSFTSLHDEDVELLDQALAEPEIL